MNNDWAQTVIDAMRENPNLLKGADPCGVIEKYYPGKLQFNKHDRAAIGDYLKKINAPPSDSSEHMLGSPSAAGCTLCCIATPTAIVGVGIGAVIASGGIAAAVAPEIATAIAADVGLSAEATAAALAAAQAAANAATGGLVMQTSAFIGTLITGLCIALGACPK